LEELLLFVPLLDYVDAPKELREVRVHYLEDDNCILIFYSVRRKEMTVNALVDAI
jgi:hypothetical protein